MHLSLSLFLRRPTVSITSALARRTHFSLIMTEMTSAKLLTEQEKQVTDIRVDESTIARRIKLTGKEEESSSLDRSLILDDNSPTRPSWERFIPG